jgi:hypothetical protein
VPDELLLVLVDVRVIVDPVPDGIVFDGVGLVVGFEDLDDVEKVILRDVNISGGMVVMVMSLLGLRSVGGVNGFVGEVDIVVRLLDNDDDSVEVGRVNVPGGLVGLVIGVDFVGVLGVERVLEVDKVGLLVDMLVVFDATELVDNVDNDGVTTGGVKSESGVIGVVVTVGIGTDELIVLLVGVENCVTVLEVVIGVDFVTVWLLLLVVGLLDDVLLV